MFKLLRYFMLISLIAFLIVGAVLGVFYREMAVNDLVDLEENKNAAITKAFANSLWIEFGPLLAAPREGAGGEVNGIDPDQIDHLQHVIMEQMAGLSVIKVKLYDLEGRTVFSTDMSQIGELNTENRGYLSARAGEVASELTHRDSFSAFEGTIEDRDVFSSYVPLQPDGPTGKIEGVFELYIDVTPLIQRIRSTQNRIAMGVTGSLAALYILLVLAIRRANRILETQYRERKQAERELRALSEELEARVENRTRQLSIANEELSQEINERRRIEALLAHDAFHDSLTGLPNRALFMDRLDHALARTRRDPGHLFAILFLDIDQFKNINDSMGHAAGDQFLKQAARRLSNALRPGDTLARLGGDEFVMLLENVHSISDSLRAADRLQDIVSDPFALDGKALFVTCSIGVAMSASIYERAEDLLRDADIAMYQAKDRGRARHQLFDSEMYAEVLTRLELETQLRQALKSQAFRLHYQPIVALLDGKLSGFEALIRWDHHKRGLVPAAEFIPLAEEAGLITKIGQWALAEACRTAKTWEGTCASDLDLTVSVNLSGKQFEQPDFVRSLEEVLQTSGLAPRCLSVEITESTLMARADASVNALIEVRMLGVGIQLDDFGIGYSSLDYLQRFPIDTLKIDRSFVQRISEGADDPKIIRAVISLAKDLGLTVVAEGVETLEQLDTLRRLGCDLAQGYFLCRPVSEEQARALIGAPPPWQEWWSYNPVVEAG